MSLVTAFVFVLVGTRVVAVVVAIVGTVSCSSRAAVVAATSVVVQAGGDSRLRK